MANPEIAEVLAYDLDEEELAHHEAKALLRQYAEQLEAA